MTTLKDSKSKNTLSNFFKKGLTSSGTNNINSDLQT